MPQNLIYNFGPYFTERFAELVSISGRDAKPQKPALVPTAGKQSLLLSESVGGGKDVEIVVVLAKHDPQGKAMPVLETLTYREDIAGSDLVYDLTGEFMQGKARPFDCDLRKVPVRLYALLPFQVEGLKVAARQQGGKIATDIEFQDALGKRVAGPLPCHATLKSPAEKTVWKKFLSSSKDGSLSIAPSLPQNGLPGKWLVIVRSLLDGKEVTESVEVRLGDGK
ncbi:MAG: hypothetical protein K8R36_23445 [Planctomycetales bacterium]|nr:hypothetical protein [Planctomycetales bacterium]